MSMYITDSKYIYKTKYRATEGCMTLPPLIVYTS